FTPSHFPPYYRDYEMLHLPFLFALLVRGAEAKVKCFHCSNALNVECTESSTCEGTSCFLAQQNISFYAGCTNEPMMQEAACFTKAPRRICGCSGELCNFGDRMGNFVNVDIPPVAFIHLSTFFDNLPPISGVPVASTEAAPAKSTEQAKASSAAPEVVASSQTSASTTDSSAENSSEEVDSSNSTTPSGETPKPNGSSVVPFLIAAVLLCTALLF
ncbi:hypothetical protein PMAYCL1PPCAC_07851, partial [Pristionchus mayeri]